MEDRSTKARAGESAGPASRRLSRREALLAGGAAVTTIGLGASGAGLVRAGGVVRAAAAAVVRPVAPAYLTRPDLRLPGLTIMRNTRAAAPGLLLLAPYNAPNPAQAGALIVDDRGQPVWEQPLSGLVTTDLRVQRYRGAPTLTWWQGVVRLGHGVGSYVVADSSYTPVAHLNAGNGRHGDLHEFLLTDRGTALLTTYEVTAADLREVGGARQGGIQDAIFQEIDIASGTVLLEWHSLDHIPITESYWPVGGDWDYVHLNSIAVDLDQNLLVSSRNTHTIYKLDRRTGRIIWRLGGKRSGFAIDADAVFAWQHDARRQPDGSITLFDNGNRHSRALVLDVDEVRRRVRLRREYTHPAGLFANSQGNVQVLPDGNVLVGWGAQPYVSEFTSDGDLIFDARFAPGYISYRAYRVPWAAQPPGAPAVIARRSRAAVDVHVSWNGDTRVSRWAVLAGAAGTQRIATVPRTGFETVIRVARGPARVRVAAVDAGGRLLATSAPVAT